MTALLDVNALIALVDSDHVKHDSMHKWFAAHAKEGWATCPLTENGMVRVLSQARYPSGQRTPAEVIEILAGLKTAHRRAHEFWPDEVSLSDGSLFDRSLIATPHQVADAYLLGLAVRRRGKVVSFDRSMPWQAIRGGSENLIDCPK